MHPRAAVACWCDQACEKLTGARMADAKLLEPLDTGCYTGAIRSASPYLLQCQLQYLPHVISAFAGGDMDLKQEAARACHQIEAIL